ncbi:MAG: hypothetical protein KGJ66_06300 [Alphaproteobacteria bacterium]|nr:hypothetical protein [Alphaproteobacteria bacterium]
MKVRSASLIHFCAAFTIVLAAGLAKPCLADPPYTITTGVPSYVSVGVPSRVSVGVPSNVTMGVSPNVTVGTPGYVSTGIPTNVSVGVPRYVAPGVAPNVSAGTPGYVSTGIPTGVSVGVPPNVTTGTSANVSAGVPSYVRTGFPNNISAGYPNYVSSGVPNNVTSGVPAYVGSTLRRYRAAQQSTYGTTRQTLDGPSDSKNGVAIREKARAPTVSGAQSEELSAAVTHNQVLFGTSIDRKTALQVLPYALMSRDAYSVSGQGTAPGVRRITDWESLMRIGGVSGGQIQQFKADGFYAAIYRNVKTGETTLAYRGTVMSLRPETGADLGTDARAAMAGAIRRVDPNYVEPQYKAASELARIAKQKFGPNISLTGHSLGGALAAYAGRTNNIARVITFDAARNVYSTSGTNANEINVVTPGEFIGDPNTGTTVVGSGKLPGKLYSVNSSAEQSGTMGDLVGTHSIDGIIGGLATVAR